VLRSDGHRTHHRSALRGIDRGDRFEIAVISVVWLTLIVTAPLVAVIFRRAFVQET
jgi:hypothetical protein